jgi:hypothetical protein
MKRLVLVTFIGSLALALTAWGAPREKHAKRAVKNKSAPSAHVVSARSGGQAAKARTSQSVRPRSKTQSVSRQSRAGRSRIEAAKTRSARTVDRNAARKASTRTTANRQRAQARADTQRRIRTERARARATQTAADRTRAAARTNLAVNRQRNLTFARNVARNRDQNVRIVNHWRNEWFRGPDYDAFYNYNRVWHDRWWWRNNYTNIVFVFGGWWYWNTGYWYPAWGYDPYGWYRYDGPIYTGYATVTPDQVMVNVQVALRDSGYYAGPIDGVIGTQSRAALAAFQADNGLAVTSAVDRPTLQTLGLT